MSLLLTGAGRHQVPAAPSYTGPSDVVAASAPGNAWEVTTPLMPLAVIRRGRWSTRLAAIRLR